MTREPDDIRLDAVLDALAPPRAAPELIERIVAAGPAPGRRLKLWPVWLLPAGLGAGLAAACAAGVVAGVQLGQAQSASTEATIAAIAGEDTSGAYSEDAA